jgi:hypothetical protein
LKHAELRVHGDDVLAVSASAALLSEVLAVTRLPLGSIALKTPRVSKITPSGTRPLVT